MKRGWVLGLLALLVLPCSAQQIMYSNLKELVEGRGDTVTILKVEKRSKNQIYLMGGADYRIEAKDNSGLCRYLKSRCYAVRMDTSLYVNCKKMRYKRYRFGGWYKFQATGVLPAAVISLSTLTKRFGDSAAFLKGITKPMSSAMALVPSSEETHQ